MKRLLLPMIIVLSITACSNQSNGSNVNIEDEAAFTTIEIDQIEDYVSDGYTVVDVREGDEYKDGHIPGALNVPLSDLQVKEFAPLSKGEQYIIICQSGNRSITASNILNEHGFEIINVREGMSSWTGDIEQ